MPHTAELQPEAFIEISPELAAETGIANLDWAVLSTARGEIEAKVLVTPRIRPFTVDGRVVHQVGMPWVFGWAGYARGDSLFNYRYFLGLSHLDSTLLRTHGPRQLHLGWRRSIVNSFPMERDVSLNGRLINTPFTASTVHASRTLVR